MELDSVALALASGARVAGRARGAWTVRAPAGSSALDHVERLWAAGRVARTAPESGAQPAGCARRVGKAVAWCSELRPRRSAVRELFSSFRCLFLVRSRSLGVDGFGRTGRAPAVDGRLQHCGCVGDAAVGGRAACRCRWRSGPGGRAIGSGRSGMGGQGRRSCRTSSWIAKCHGADRDSLPLVVDGDDRIVWVVGQSVAEDFRVTEPSQGVILLKARRLGGLG